MLLLLVSKANATELRHNLSVGDSGVDVLQLQKRLIELRYLSGKADGVFGQGTYNAVTRFERELGLPVDGVVTKKEWLILFPPPPATATVKINGKTQSFAQPPLIINGSTLVPFRGILEVLGVQVNWEGATQTITATRGNDRVTIQIGSQFAVRNGVSITLHQPALIVNSVAMVPIRFIGQTFANEVNWDAATRTVLISADIVISPSTGKKMILGYYPIDYPGDKRAYNSMLSFGESLGAIAVFAFLLDGNYRFSGTVPAEQLGAAEKRGIKSLLVIHNYRNGGFDRNLVHNLLNDRKSWDKFIGDVLQLVKNHGFSGVNVDFENIPPGDRSQFSDFLRRMAGALKSNGYQFMVAVPAKTHNDPQNAWAGAFDYQVAGQVSDYVVLMTYDQHWSGGPPGPVASLSWVKKVLDYAVTCIPKDKLLVGIPAYGYDWSSRGTQVVRWNQAAALISKYGKDKVVWDSAAASPHLRYTEAGVNHEVWFENEHSLKPKLDLVTKYGVAGLSVWRLGFENSVFWETIKRYY
jgi:spore germination protein YaaH